VTGAPTAGVTGVCSGNDTITFPVPATLEIEVSERMFLRLLLANSWSYGRCGEPARVALVVVDTHSGRCVDCESMESFPLTSAARGFPQGLPRGLLSCAMLLLAGLSGTRAGRGQTPYELVNPHVGTANEGQTAPFVGPPFAMTSWTPQTRPDEKKCVAPYYARDKAISGFRGTHWISGSCSLDYGTVSLMPVTGAIHPAPEERAAAFERADEVSRPAYYAVALKRYGERVEMTATARTGLLRISFPAGADATVLVEPNVKPFEGYVEVDASTSSIFGYNPVRRFYQGGGKSAGFSGYFVVRFQQPFTSWGTWCGTELHPGVPSERMGCTRLGGYATFAKHGNGPVLVKVGTSLTSLEEARKNLDAEDPGWDFEAVRKETEAKWVHWMDAIEVEGGSVQQRRTFYTALYHAALGPRAVNDADGTYNGFAQEGQWHRLAAGAEYYDDYSMWDTFRAVHPLFTIIDPQRDERMVQSLVLKGQQGGYLPIFPMWNSYTSAMVGDHAVAVIVDAYAKGLRNFDVASAYRLIRKNAMQTPPYAEYEDGRGRRSLASYEKYGYIPLEDPVLDAFHGDEQVSRTLEYAYDDALIGDLAAALGKADDAALFRKRSENWRNVFDAKVGFVRGRHIDGSWDAPFDPAKPYRYITEGLPWQYTFFVPQNVTGLVEAMGGAKSFSASLDGLFARKLYDQGNEPSHHITYLYNYAGAPWKTQERVRSVMAEYTDTDGGLPGNDDDGQMSAWYIFSAMGFYPICAGRPVYAIGSPIFDKVTIHVGAKQFVVRANHQSPTNLYIQSMTLNGQPHAGYEFSHAEVMQGGELVLEMGSAPRMK
jgi:predicted alpha-1,2-mannosidase